MLTVRVLRGDIDGAIKRLRKLVSKDGYLRDLKYQSIAKPSERKKQKAQKAESRRMKREHRRLKYGF